MKNIYGHFAQTLEKKKLGQTFSIRTIFWELLGSSDIWDLLTQILTIFTKNITFSAKKTYLIKKIMATIAKTMKLFSRIFFFKNAF